MPTLGRPTAEPEYGLAQVPFHDKSEARRFHENIRNSQRVNIPDEPEPIAQLSEDTKVYIYNVSPWTFLQPMGSCGSFTIPGLEEAKVLNGEFYVAGPLVIPGLPKEYYPTEGAQARSIYHQPKRNMGRDTARPGLDFAMEIIGNGKHLSPSNDLRRVGVFVSEQIEQSRPDPNAMDKSQYRIAMTAFERWIADVKKAQAMLREKCAQLCQDANIAHSQGKIQDVRNDQLYQAARLIKKTEMDCPWLKDTVEASDKKECLACGTVLKGFALKCSSCGTLQVTQEEFDAEILRRTKSRM